MVRFARGSSDEEIIDPFLRPLFNDMVQSEELLDSASVSQLQFARRTYFRTSFAFLDGHLYWLKNHVIQWVMADSRRRGRLEVPKLTLLDDRTYKPDQTGRIVNEPNRIPFLNLSALILRTAAECWNIDAGPFFSDNGWSAMRSSLAVRHRLTHPKKTEDLEISAAEVDTMRGGHTWFYNCLVDILSGARKSGK
jgi:hypothetical protein